MHWSYERKSFLFITSINTSVKENTFNNEKCYEGHSIPLAQITSSDLLGHRLDAKDQKKFEDLDYLDSTSRSF